MSRYPTWKRRALKWAEKQVIEIEDDGHKVLRFTDHHWRIDGMDVWPSSKKYKKYGVIKEYVKLKDIFKI